MVKIVVVNRRNVLYKIDDFKIGVDSEGNEKRELRAIPS